MPNGGLQVVNPSAGVYDRILSTLQNPSSTINYEFADQSLLSDLFPGRWVPLPYIYNALKTMRWPHVHATIWRDDQVKNMHYLLSPKPWDEEGENKGKTDEANPWWWVINDERLADEKKNEAITDAF